jgi:hypothetical protein
MEHLLPTTLRYEGHPEVPWEYGLYPGSADGDEQAVDPAFGDGVPDEITGAYAHANQRVRVRVEAADNHPGAPNTEFIDQRGLNWWIEDKEGTRLAGDNPEHFLVRFPTFPPREGDEEEEEHLLVVTDEDASENRLEQRLPVYFIPLDFSADALEFSQSRVTRRR